MRSHAEEGLQMHLLIEQELLGTKFSCLPPICGGKPAFGFQLPIQAMYLGIRRYTTSELGSSALKTVSPSLDWSRKENLGFF